jgi:hypothetical protein
MVINLDISFLLYIDRGISEINRYLDRIRVLFCFTA